ncbi:phosphomannomutase/phosphoglucomutase [Methylomonas sp. LL1]|uniref:phosphomannomutase/phosphoglucomutase n=1 Tax=Methylomonas sp. LL1 TaxID=2785785 RepID=UPI0018C430D1|nr:phosphomannomutase/phosphoglucomutase [Methylomonas sp. LL1]QPK63411.1 phosphomannomutase/phosphoglucomutase [Methylomonas sp. LL1]
MARIFSIIAAISALMVILAGGGAYWFSTASTKYAKQEAITTVANGLAAGLSMQLDTLQNSVDGVAQSPDVIAALASGNPELINATAVKLQHVIPHNLRLRLLPPGVNDLDQSQSPHMGFGDLEMVKATLTGQPKPVIQGEGEHRHLAFTSPVSNGQQVIGVVLASVKPDLPQKIVSKTQFNNGLIELKQDQLVLATIGNTDNRDDEPRSIQLPNGRWQLDTWPEIKFSMSDTVLIITIIALPALLACLGFFISYRKLHDFFLRDQSSILRAAKDMLQGKHVGNYPMQLEEMQPLIAAMAQFKRVIGQDNIPLSETGDNKEYDFFDESFDIDFLDESPAAANEPLQTAPIKIPDLPVSMPNIDDSDDWQTPSQAAATSVPIPSSAKPELRTETAESMPVRESWDMDFTATPTKTAAPAQPSTATLADSQPLPVASIFRDYDIIGIVGKNINEDIVANLGRAFASEARQLGIKTIVVARDGRTSSPVLSAALIKGITSAGCDVLDIGLVPTPILYFVSHHSEGRSGVIVTGGQHPADYNGLKMVLNGEPLSSEQIQGLKSRIERNDYNQDQAGSVEQNSLFSSEYIGIISEDTHIVRPMTVVMDCANGAAGELGPMLLKTIGCDVVELYCEIDGQFPNHQPDPGNPANLDALIKAVKLNNADVGIAFNGDGDRMLLVDSAGKIIWPDRQMMLFARDVLASKPGSEIIYDAACSKHLPEKIKQRGGYPVRWKSGATPLQSRLRETGAALAGDMSGHFLFNDRWFGFSDALYAAVRMIEILSADMRSSSEMFDDLPDSISTPELYVPLADGESIRFIEQMFSLAQFNDADIVNIDGMRAEFPDGWGLVRASNTSPALVVRFEADTREALNRIQAQFKYLMLQIKPDISLPF